MTQPPGPPPYPPVQPYAPPVPVPPAPTPEPPVRAGCLPTALTAWLSLLAVCTLLVGIWGLFANEQRAHWGGDVVPGRVVTTERVNHEGDVNCQATVAYTVDDHAHRVTSGEAAHWCLRKDWPTSIEVSYLPGPDGPQGARVLYGHHELQLPAIITVLIGAVAWLTRKRWGGRRWLIPIGTRWGKVALGVSAVLVVVSVVDTSREGLDHAALDDDITAHVDDHAQDHTGPWTDATLTDAAGEYRNLLLRVDGGRQDGGVLVFKLEEFWFDPRRGPDTFEADCLRVTVTGNQVTDSDRYDREGSSAGVPC